MEKVIYLVWGEQSTDAGQFSTYLRTVLAERLLALGARGLQVNVQDSEVAAAAGLRLINTRPQPDAMVSAWVDSAVDALRSPFDKAVAAAVPGMAAYLVSESMPIRNTRHPPRPGQRTEGWAQVALLARPPGVGQPPLCVLIHGGGWNKGSIGQSIWQQNTLAAAVLMPAKY